MAPNTLPLQSGDAGQQITQYYDALAALIGRHAPSTQSVLNVGIATGALPLRLTNLFESVIASDFSQKFVDAAIALQKGRRARSLYLGLPLALCLMRIFQSPR